MTVAATANPLPALTRERATALNSAMFNLAMEREGLRKVPWNQITLLREASLLELAHAGAIVKKHDDEKPAGPDGSRSFSMVCDDRLVAAIYTFLHYAIPPASQPYDDDYLILKLTDTSHTYFLLAGAREKAELEFEDDNEEAT